MTTLLLVVGTYLILWVGVWVAVLVDPNRGQR